MNESISNAKRDDIAARKKFLVCMDEVEVHRTDGDETGSIRIIYISEKGNTPDV